jgi:hypothetical protein
MISPAPTYMLVGLSILLAEDNKINQKLAIALLAGAWISWKMAIRLLARCGAAIMILC